MTTKELGHVIDAENRLIYMMDGVAFLSFKIITKSTVSRLFSQVSTKLLFLKNKFLILANAFQIPQNIFYFRFVKITFYGRM